jgi:hypothetical protein
MAVDAADVLSYVSLVAVALGAAVLSGLAGMVRDRHHHDAAHFH